MNHIETLEQALEFCEFCWRDVPMNEHAFERTEQTIIALRTAIEQAEKREPVAWMRKDGTLRFAAGKVFAVGQPFYTTPPAQPAQRQPLTDEQISEIASALEQQGNTMRQFARAIEAAHGITGEKT
jgi:hypothetical protein